MKVLIPTDFSSYSEKTIKCSLELTKIEQCEMLLLNVIELDLELIDSFAGVTAEDVIRVLRNRAESKLKEYVEFFQNAGVDAKYVEPIPVGDPVAEIIKVADEEKVSLILIGSKGKGMLKKALMGSVSEGVLRCARIPVFVMKFKVEDEITSSCSIFERVLFAFDSSESSQKLLEFIKKVPAREILALHIMEEEIDADLILKVKSELENVKVMIKTGKPHKEILKTAEAYNATMIAVGSGKDELGSTAEMVVRHAKIPVLVYKC